MDFPDALIAQLGRAAAARYGEKYDGFYTFDEAARAAIKGAKAP